MDDGCELGVDRESGADQGSHSQAQDGQLAGAARRLDAIARWQVRVVHRNLAF